MPNKYTVIRSLIMNQTEPFCLIELYVRLEQEGIKNRDDISFVLDDLYANGILEYAKIEPRHGVEWAYKVVA